MLVQPVPTVPIQVQPQSHAHYPEVPNEPGFWVLKNNNDFFIEPYNWVHSLKESTSALRLFNWRAEAMQYMFAMDSADMTEPRRYVHFMPTRILEAHYKRLASKADREFDSKLRVVICKNYPNEYPLEVKVLKTLVHTTPRSDLN